MNAKEKFLEKINFGKLLRPQYFEFIKRYRTAVREIGAETFGFLPIWDVFQELYVELDQIFKPIVKSALTPELQELDDKRDKLFSGFKKNATSFIDGFDAQKKIAAQKLMPVFDAYRNVAEKDRESETALLYNFIQELNTKHAAELTSLGLQSWVVELDKANKEFENKWIERNTEEKVGKPERKFEEVAPEIDYYYDLMIWKLEWLMNDSPSEIVKKFVEEWNGVIDYYKYLIAQREGHKESEK